MSTYTPSKITIADQIHDFLDSIGEESDEVWPDWATIWTKAPDGAIARQHAEGWNDLAESITLLRKAEGKLRKA